jgi:DNA processing protein
MNDADLRDLLRLTLTPGIGPVLIGRLIERYGSAREVAAATRSGLKGIDKIGPKKADLIAEGLAKAAPLVEEELALADQLGVRFIAQSDPDYPPLLATIPQAPPLLSIRGHLDPQQADAFPVAIVGSRRCTAYGIEQAERFASVLSSTGLTVVSGGARGIDTAAHRGALRAQGRTIAVLGCGLARCYPPDNKDLFDQIVASGSAILSELPLRTEPDSSNFPARNRIISGIALGTLVVEASKRSGSLITARIAAEDHAREVMALPGRVDSKASEGSLHLIQQGGAALVVEPADVIQLLETPARHSFHGTHESRYVGETQLFETTKPAEKPREIGSLSDAQRTILNAIQSPLTMDDLSTATGLPPETLRAEITMLEIQKRIVREGSRIAARSR